MEMAWCSKCHADVSLAHAVAELPCPACGGSSFFLMADVVERESLLLEAERMLRLGRWPDAADALKRCFDRELISAADLNLSAANLEWRKQCAAAAGDLVAGGGLPLDSFRFALVAEYDEYVVEWLLREYRGIRLIPDGGSYLVEGC